MKNLIIILIMFVCSSSLMYGQETIDKKQEKGNTSLTKTTKKKKARVVSKDETEVAPKFLLKLKPYASAAGFFLKLNYEQAISPNRTIEIEGGLGRPFDILKDSYFERDSYNITARLKKYSNRTLKGDLVHNGNNLMKGYYYAPVITAGNVIRYNYSQDTPAFTNYYVSALLDVGYQFIVKNFVFDVFTGVGLSYNSSANNLLHNETHSSFKSLAFRFGLRTGIKFE